MPPLKLGTAIAKPGEITYGEFDVMGLPTGNQEVLPVIIAQGRRDGPVMWITSGIHGGEHTGIVTIQQLITPELVASLRGTIVAIPVLNPGGLRTKQRMPYYSQTDPNRMFPRPDRRRKTIEGDGKPTHPLEQAYDRLFDAIVSSQPAALFDLHNAWFGSIPFAFRDPVFYRKGRGFGPSRAEAQKLQVRVGEMLDVFGFTVINEFVADDYVSKNLHRSVSGAVLNGACIPAVTIELGSWMHVDAHVANGARCGLRNVLRWLDMLPGEREPIVHIPVIRIGKAVRRYVFPYAPATGIVHHLVRPGERIEPGQPLVRMTDIYGRPLLDDDGLIRSQHEGFVMAWHHGIVHYQGDPLMDIAIPDDGDLLIPYENA